MTRSVVPAAAIAITTWAGFAFQSNSRSELASAEHAVRETQIEPDRLANVRVGQELVTEGCEGEQVSQVQRLLNARGANPQVAVSGIFDRATDYAVRQFQSRHVDRKGNALAKDGSVGMETLYALEHAEAKAPQRPIRDTGVLADVLNQVRLYKEGDSGVAVREIKRLLNNAGASPRLRDSETFDSATSHAVVAFQSRWNAAHASSDTPRLPIDGLVKRRTAEALVAAGTRSALSEAAGAVGNTFSGKKSGPAPLANFDTFESCLAMVLKFEGGLSRDKNDRGNRGGNCTMQGVTQASYDQYRDHHEQPRRDVSRISASEVKQLYYEQYWLAGKCSRLPQPLAVAHFNACVNMGPRAAAGILQSALDVKVDRIIGPKTVRAAQEVDPYSATERYLDLVEARYRQVAKIGANHTFLNGWLNRLHEVRVSCGVKSRPLPLMALTGSAPVDYGPAFSEGLRNLQIEKGLTPSGMLDDATETALQRGV